MSNAGVTVVSALLLGAIAAGCVHPMPEQWSMAVAGAPLGCPSTPPAPWERTQTQTDTIGDVLAILGCRGPSDSYPLLRARVPGTRDYDELPEVLGNYLVNTGADIRVDWYTKDDFIQPGQVPVSPLEEADIDGIRSFAMRISFGGGGDRIAMTTSVDVPPGHSPWQAQGTLPASQGADLSATGLAALLAGILSQLDTPEASRIDLLVFAGEHGFHGWTNLSFKPYSETRRSEFQEYVSLFHWANLGGCNWSSHPSPIQNARQSTRNLLAQVSEMAEPIGLTLSTETLGALGQGPGQWGVYVNPATAAPAVGVPAVSIDGGWWSREGPEGSPDDTVASVCIATVAKAAALVAEVIRNSGNMTYPVVSECERQPPYRCEGSLGRG